MIEAGIELENPWPGLMHAKDALQALQDMREDMLLDGELGEGGRRLNPISGMLLIHIEACPAAVLIQHSPSPSLVYVWK